MKRLIATSLLTLLIVANGHATVQTKSAEQGKNQPTNATEQVRKVDATSHISVNEKRKEIHYYGPIEIQNEKFTDTKVTIYGMSKVESTTFGQKLKVLGTLNVTGSVFKDETEVSGAISASKCTFEEELKVHGNVNLDGCLFKKELKIQGMLTANNCNFKDISINTDNMKLINSTVDKIEVKREGGFEGKTQTITLENTIVKGDIEFKSNIGRVILLGNSKIEGEIEGGRVIEGSAGSPQMGK